MDEYKLFSDYVGKTPCKISFLHIMGHVIPSGIFKNNANGETPLSQFKIQGILGLHKKD